jgi:hypothetical protein
MEYQPENLAQMQFMDSIRPAVSANLHGGIEVVDYPWDAFPYDHVDDSWFRWASRKYADTAQQRAYPVLYMSAFEDGIVAGWEWYAIRGGRMDYVTYFLHGREVTLEVSNQKHPPPDELPYFWYYNQVPLLQYIENCLFGIQGTVRDGADGKPMAAVVRVVDHEKDRSYTLSNGTTGYFTRMIGPGTWTLEVSAPGYETVTVLGITVENDRARRVDIQLERWATGLLNQDLLDIHPNPFADQAVIGYRATLPGRYQLRLYDLKGRLVMEDQLFHDTAGIYRYQLNAGGLVPDIYLLELISPMSTTIRKIYKIR